jgi:hypothetical protein
MLRIRGLLVPGAGASALIDPDSIHEWDRTADYAAHRSE